MLFFFSALNLTMTWTNRLAKQLLAVFHWWRCSLKILLMMWLIDLNVGVYNVPIAAHIDRWIEAHETFIIVFVLVLWRRNNTLLDEGWHEVSSVLLIILFVHGTFPTILKWLSFLAHSLHFGIACIQRILIKLRFNLSACGASELIEVKLYKVIN